MTPKPRLDVFQGPLHVQTTSGSKVQNTTKRENPAFLSEDGAQKGPGSVLLSHTLTRAVPSALEGLTSEFEMGSGMAPPTLPPEELEVSARALLMKSNSTEMIGFRGWAASARIYDVDSSRRSYSQP